MSLPHSLKESALAASAIQLVQSIHTPSKTAKLPTFITNQDSSTRWCNYQLWFCCDNCPHQNDCCLKTNNQKRSFALLEKQNLKNSRLRLASTQRGQCKSRRGEHQNKKCMSHTCHQEQFKSLQWFRKTFPTETTWIESSSGALLQNKLSP